MTKTTRATLVQFGSSLNVLAFLSLGLLIGQLNQNTKTVLVLAFVTALLFASRLMILIATSESSAVIQQFRDWLFEAGIVFIAASFQQAMPVLIAVLLVLGVIMLLLWFLFVMSKLLC